MTSAMRDSSSIIDLAPPPADFRTEVLAGLTSRPKSLPSKFFYDARGSELFERICELPEYYLTRTELEIMQRHAGTMARIIGPDAWVIEYGSGSGVKTRLLLDRLREPAGYLPIEISRAALESSYRSLRSAYPSLQVRPVLADFTRPMDLPTAELPCTRRVVYFPGSTLGNFAPGDAKQLLRATAALVGPGGFLLLGADRKKDPNRLHAAYNDSAGVTAQFNLNLLHRINEELDAAFPLDRFAHYAFYEPRHGRIEMHLVSLDERSVLVAGEMISFAAGESIRTEYSCKYSLSDLEELAAAAHFNIRETWTDSNNDFSVQLWQAN